MCLFRRERNIQSVDNTSPASVTPPPEGAGGYQQDAEQCADREAAMLPTFFGTTKPSQPLSLGQQQGKRQMKLTTIALATAVAVSSTFALAQESGGMRPSGAPRSTGQAGPNATGAPAKSENSGTTGSSSNRAAKSHKMDNTGSMGTTNSGSSDITRNPGR